VTVQEVPNPRQLYRAWVTDMADLLNPETISEVNQMISRLEAENSSEIAVVTVSDTKPYQTPKQFATELFNYWGIGKKGKDNGVLFLISESDLPEGQQRSYRRVEIEIGYGIEKILPKARIRSIIEQEIVPYFQQGDFSGGTLAGTKALIAVLRENPITAVSSKAANMTPAANEVFYALLGILVLACGWCISVFLRPTGLEPEGKSRGYASAKDAKADCVKCRQAMEKLDSQSLLSYLSPAEQVAQRIGSVSFDGWRCPNCYPNLTGRGFHLRTYVLDNSRFSTCPNCQFLTVERTVQVTQPATEYQEGKRLVTKKCQCCTYYQANVETIPRITSSSGDTYYSDSGGSSCDGGSSWGGDSGGGDFGGGDSGGGGDGGGW